jgi:hypothetical protein
MLTSPSVAGSHDQPTMTNSARITRARVGLPGDPDDAEEDDPAEDNHDAEELMYAEPRKRRMG